MGEVSLSAWPRQEHGKCAAGRLRREGFVPAVLYGPGIDKNENLKLSKKDVDKLIKTSSSNVLVNLSIEGGKSRKVMLKTVDREPVKDAITHVDLINVLMDHKITISVPVHIVGKAAGIEAGGILQQEMRKIHVECLPSAIPDKIDVDVTALNIGDSVHVKDLAVPAGVKIKDDGGFTVVLVSAPTAEVTAKTAEEVKAELEKSFEEKEKPGEEKKAGEEKKGEEKKAGGEKK